ncbi:DNA-directed RNA polymerase subunit RPC12/RpoP [Bacillus ectoiniformans]|nr:hypothetical protein [Bacillus ectoiniformans]MBM7650534.1 DNA-directed RNA polymerase subunit RPC12/RpoP [Bacillus ectoiniformans]
MKKCTWCGKNTTKDNNQKREGMCASCWAKYKRIGKNIGKYA